MNQTQTLAQGLFQTLSNGVLNRDLGSTLRIYLPFITSFFSYYYTFIKAVKSIEVQTGVLSPLGL